MACGKLVAKIFGDPKVGRSVAGWTSFADCGQCGTLLVLFKRLIYSLFQSMKRALVASIPKVESVVQENISGAPSQTPSCFAPPIKNPGGATANNRPKLSSGRGGKFYLS